jgi:regulator of replication initiation timing
MMMKNKYEIGQNYILTLENEQLRDRIMELTKKFNELKKKYESVEERIQMAQSEGGNAVIQE